MFRGKKDRVKFILNQEEYFCEMFLDPENSSIFKIEYLENTDLDITLSIGTRINLDRRGDSYYQEIHSFFKDQVANSNIAKARDECLKYTSGLIELFRVDLVYSTLDVPLKQYINYSVFLTADNRLAEKGTIENMVTEINSTGIFTGIVRDYSNYNYYFLLTGECSLSYFFNSSELFIVTKKYPIIEDALQALRIFNIPIWELTVAHLQCLYNLTSYEQFFSYYGEDNIRILADVIQDPTIVRGTFPYTWSPRKLSDMGIMYTEEELDCVQCKRKTHYYYCSEDQGSKRLPFCSYMCLDEYGIVIGF